MFQVNGITSKWHWSVNDRRLFQTWLLIAEITESTGNSKLDSRAATDQHHRFCNGDFKKNPVHHLWIQWIPFEAATK